MNEESKQVLDSGNPLEEVWSISPFEMAVISLPSHNPICLLENSDEKRAFERGILIAQAPKMYRALKDIMSFFGPGTMPDEVFERVNMVLRDVEKKAENT